jgi:UDP-glucose 4-epimerase
MQPSDSRSAASLSDQLTDKRILVTGGAGFVGSGLVARLLREDVARVRVLDDLSTGSSEALPTRDPRLELIEGTVTDFATVVTSAKGMDVLFHLAARNIIVSTKNPREDFEVNIGGTLNVLLAAREATKVRVVYSSSASVYGNPRHLPIHEESPVDTLSPYSVSKLAAENYCKAFYESYDVSTSVVRYSNVFGPGQRPENPYCGVISKFISESLRGRPPCIHGDGEQTRDFTYVDDAVEATVCAGVSAKADGQIYNVATGRETSVNTLARLIMKAAALEGEPEHIDRRDIDNIRRRALNIERIRTQLRWVPAVGLEEGVKRTVAWMAERESRVDNHHP